MDPIGLYLHFPFCKRKCNYCDFNSYSGIEDLIPSYIEALKCEINRFLPCSYPVRSVYFGGGTPSYLPSHDVSSLLIYLKKNFHIDSNAEITLEVNPGTTNRTALTEYRRAGFNRLSIGLQATQDSILKTLGRIHGWGDFIETFQTSQEIGFSNIGIDLIYGLPGQSLGDWEETLAKVVSLNPTHISAYGLQIEEGTPFGKMMDEGRLGVPSEAVVVTMMETAMRYLPDHGYLQYEISNYARPGFESIHNIGYWKGEPYLGFGAGATSTLHRERWTNFRDPTRYIQAVLKGSPAIAEREAIDQKTAAVERLMLGLRMRAGLDMEKFKEEYLPEPSLDWEEEIDFLEEQGFIYIEGRRIGLTDRGIPVSNEIIARLLRYL